MTKRILLAFFAFAWLIALASATAKAGPATPAELASLPKASGDADYVIRLWSATDNVSFSVDGVPVGIARSPYDRGLKVLINPTKSHTFAAESPGYKKPAPHFVQPDYKGLNDEIQFIFDEPADSEVAEAPSDKRGNIIVNGRAVFVDGDVTGKIEVNDSIAAKPEHRQATQKKKPAPQPQSGTISPPSPALQSNPLN